MQITKELIDQKLAAYVAQVRESFGDIYADPLAARIDNEMAVFAENQEHFGLPGLEHDRTLNFRACIEFLHIHRLAELWKEIPGSRQAGVIGVATRYLVEDATRYIQHRIAVTGLGRYTELLVEISEFELIAALLYTGVEIRHKKRKAHYRNGQNGIETFAVLPRARFNACREMHRRQGDWIDPQHRAWLGSPLADK